MSGSQHVSAADFSPPAPSTGAPSSADVFSSLVGTYGDRGALDACSAVFKRDFAEERARLFRVVRAMLGVDFFLLAGPRVTQIFCGAADPPGAPLTLYLPAGSEGGPAREVHLAPQYRLRRRSGWHHEVLSELGDVVLRITWVPLTSHTVAELYDFVLEVGLPGVGAVAWDDKRLYLPDSEVLDVAARVVCMPRGSPEEHITQALFYGFRVTEV